jgi:hypothetical protein
VPSTATFPVTAGPHVAAVLSASDGTLVAHVLPLDGSPMTSAEYALNCVVVIASHVAADATVTEYPAGTAFASALDDPPFTLVDKISTDPDPDACAGLATATLTAAAAVTPAATTDAGTSPGTTPVTGTVTSATSRRARLGNRRQARPAAKRTTRAEPLPPAEPVSEPKPAISPSLTAAMHTTRAEPRDEALGTVSYR